jgi:TonB family protein
VKSSNLKKVNIMKRHAAILMSFMLLADAASGQDNPSEDTFIPFDVEPAITSRVSPEYPKEALSKSLEGMVWLKVYISEGGLPENIEVLKSSDQVFERAAVDAARQFRFSPGQIKGKPVASWVSIPFKFKLGPVKQSGDQNGEWNSPDVQPSIKSRADAYYPEMAQRSGQEGTVWVTVFVDTSGRAKEAVVVKSTSEVFNESALAAARKTLFTPAKKNNKPVTAWVTIPFQYKLGTKKTER